jgi:hypothetical protein
MGLLDLLVVGTLGLMASWPWIATAVSSFVAPRSAASAATSAVGSPIEEWRQTWASTLITLIDDLENGEGHVPDSKAALRLSKELLWEIIGGDGTPPSKAK